MNIFVFDIETIPDCDASRRLHDSPEWSDSDAANALFAGAREQSGRDFLAHYLQKIIVISAVLKTPQGVKVWSLGQEDADEKELITRFFDGIERYSPTLVSWNGSGFDLPVLHYRALLHGVAAPRYWETGDNDSQFRWNNYLSRFHQRHLKQSVCTLRSHRHFIGLSWQNGYGWRSSMVGVSRRKIECHTQLLRNRCVKHLFSLFAF
jgi:predicted PolB exonuclease-like 3'-5' exonuclease